MIAVFYVILLGETKRDVKTAAHNLIILVYGIYNFAVYGIVMLIMPEYFKSNYDPAFIMIVIAAFTTFAIDKTVLFSKNKRRIIICTIAYCFIVSYSLYNLLNAIR